MLPPPSEKDKPATYLIVHPWIWALSSLAGKNFRRNTGPPPMCVLHGHLLQNSKRTRQVLGYHLIMSPVCFPFSFC